jgi:benzodiazapine receptor
MSVEKNQKKKTMNRYFKLFISILSPLIIGSLSGVATATSVKTWYVTLNKPFFNPPNYLFGPVWTTLYVLMGISLYMIWQSPSTASKKNAMIAFCLQLFLNFWWSFLFFQFHLIGIAFVEIVLIWISIFWMIREFSKINTIAAYLQIPYLLWVSFATILNGSIWWLN